METSNFLLRARDGISHFFTKAKLASARVLFADYDGTLAPFCLNRDAALPYPLVPELLEQIQQVANTHVVVVSGRRAADVDRLLGLKDLEIWGCHGLERRFSDGTYQAPQFNREYLQQLNEANELMGQTGLSALLELKPTATAVHWRGLEDRAFEIAGKVQSVWSQLQKRDGLLLTKFDGGMEIRIAGRNKGDAVSGVLAEIKEDVAAAYLGDDQTDEDAFLALRGRGLSVLVRKQYRLTAADVWIRPPVEVVEFLSEWATACGGNS